jgi:hypothetical protein
VVFSTFESIPPVWEDLCINQLTIKGKLDKTSPTTKPKFGQASEPPKYNFDFTITNKIIL